MGHSYGTLLWDTLVGHSSYETSSKSHASNLKNERFVGDFLQKSHVKSPKRAFRTRLPAPPTLPQSFPSGWYWPQKSQQLRAPTQRQNTNTPTYFSSPHHEVAYACEDEHEPTVCSPLRSILRHQKHEWPRVMEAGMPSPNSPLGVPPANSLTLHSSLVLHEV